MKKRILKNRDVILLTIGTLLIILSLCLIFYDRFGVLKSNVFSEIEMLKYRENSVNNDNDYVDDSDIDYDIDVDYIDDGDDDDEVTSTNKKSSNSKIYSAISKEYIGFLEIKKINLRQGFLSTNSYYNKVKYNIQTIVPSDYPDKPQGNLILAAHSGTGYLAFFKNLYKLKLGDEATIYYKGNIYTYKIVDIYNVPKVGQVKINRDIYKTCLTLITCTHGSKKEQTVYILELTNKVKDGV